MTERHKETVYVVTDDKGKAHKVKTNFLKQKERQAITTPRTLIWFAIAIKGSMVIMEKTDGIMSYVWIILLLLVARRLLFSVIVSKEELKTLRTLKEGEKLS